MSYINRYLRNFKPYKVASHKIWQVDNSARKEILKLDWNESTQEPSPLVKERLQNLLNSDFLNYYPATYNEELHNLLAEFVQLPKENVQYFASSDSLHEYISKMFITVGDPVLILWPSYDNFRLTAQVAGAHVMYFELDGDFRFDREAFENKIIRKEPSLVYICNPNNPTGLVLDVDYIEHLLNKFPQAMFLIDEAYIEFCGKSCKDLVKDYDNILITRTMSKAFGLANIRFGFLLASEENINYISSIRNPKNITTFAQEAVIGALLDVDYMWNYVNEVNIAKEAFIKKINENTSNKFKAYKSNANFVMVRCDCELTKHEILAYLERHNVFIRNISQSESVKECVRITIGTQEEMDYVASLFEEYVSAQENKNRG